MMRYQRVIPDLLHLPSGKKPAGTNHNTRTCKEDEASYPLPRARPGSANLVQSHFPPTSDPPPSEPQTSSNGNGRDMLLRWGHNKRSRGPRAESRTAGYESTSSSSRQMIKAQRRATVAGAEKIAEAGAAMPPPCGGGYMRGANLRPCTPSSTTNHNRTVEERSGGQSRPEKNRSPPSPPDKPRSKPTAAAPRNGFGPDPAAMNHLHHADSKAAVSDHRQETSGETATGKTNLEQFEWPRIYVSLSRKEKEDDFLAMKGTKLPQRPKKRAKNIDKSLQYCFPGMWLSDLTRGRYEVREKKCVKKVRTNIYFCLKQVGGTFGKIVSNFIWYTHSRENSRGPRLTLLAFNSSLLVKILLVSVVVTWVQRCRINYVWFFCAKILKLMSKYEKLLLIFVAEAKGVERNGEHGQRFRMKNVIITVLWFFYCCCLGIVEERCVHFLCFFDFFSCTVSSLIMNDMIN